MSEMHEAGFDPSERRIPTAAVAGSICLHAVVGLLMLLGATRLSAEAPPRTYRVRLVAPAQKEAPKRLKPEPAKAAPEKKRPPPPQPTTKKTKPKVEQPTEVKKQPTPEPKKEPASAEETGTDPVNVKLEGAAFPFPDYLANIIRQVHRYWRPPSGGQALRAEVAFTIDKDGSVSHIDWVRRSGSAVFDLEARGAIEAAGRNKAFGPLPGGYRQDHLRISFFFDPSTL